VFEVLGAKGALHVPIIPHAAGAWTTPDPPPDLAPGAALVFRAGPTMMWRWWIGPLAAMTATAGLAASAAPLDQLYERRELESLQSRYLRGMVRQLRERVQAPLDAGVANSLEHTKFHVPVSVPTYEPLAFYTAGPAITASAASIRVLDDLRFRLRLARDERVRPAHGCGLSPHAALLVAAREAADRGSLTGAVTPAIHQARLELCARATAPLFPPRARCSGTS
jgi:hypothetical protein